ncbi:MAG: hypothetical protein H6733_10925 [Alphaproteobacteria bacterium]|nr:hypothetical protein [Alphaproteobacteria bacterium]
MRSLFLVSVALVATGAACAPTKDTTAGAVDTDRVDTHPGGSDTDTDTDGVDTVDTDEDSDTVPVDTDAPVPRAVALDLTPSVTYTDEPLWQRAADALADAQVRLQADLDAIQAAQDDLAATVPAPCALGPRVWRDGAGFLSVDVAIDADPDPAVLLLCPGLYRQPTLSRRGQQARVGPVRWGQRAAIRSDAVHGALTGDTQLTVAGVTVFVDATRPVWLPSGAARLSLVDVDVDLIANGSLVAPGGAVDTLDVVRTTVTGTGGALYATVAPRHVFAQNRVDTGAVATWNLVAGTAVDAADALTVLADNDLTGSGAQRAVFAWGSARSVGTLVSLANRWQGNPLLANGSLLRVEGDAASVGVFADRFAFGELSGGTAMFVTSWTAGSSFRAVDVDVVDNTDLQHAVLFTGPMEGTNDATWLRGRIAGNATSAPAVAVRYGWTATLEHVDFGTGGDANAGGDAINCGPLAGADSVVVTVSTCSVDAP